MIKYRFGGDNKTETQATLFIFLFNAGLKTPGFCLLIAPAGKYGDTLVILHK
jgi:hypothetical protein